jgi:long-chain acyl-CoA synthetase
MNLGNSLSASAARNPRKLAIAIENESIPYEELEHSSASLARWLLRHGCKPGDRVAIHWPNSIEMVKLLFACFKAGMIAVPVNVRLKALEVTYLLTHSKAAICFAHPDLIGVTRDACRGRASGLRLQSSLESLDDGHEKIALPNVNEHDPALILYTSRTTAQPKGVTHTHRTLLEGASLVRGVVPPAGSKVCTRPQNWLSRSTNS